MNLRFILGKEIIAHELAHSDGTYLQCRKPVVIFKISVTTSLLPCNRPSC